jgi:hypothetical protein
MEDGGWRMEGDEKISSEGFGTVFFRFRYGFLFGFDTVCDTVVAKDAIIKKLF